MSGSGFWERSREDVAMALCIGALLRDVGTCRRRPQHRPRYKLRVGDVLDVEYVYTPELNQTVTVSPDGYINLNLVGDVKVIDLSLDASARHDCSESRRETECAGSQSGTGTVPTSPTS